MIAVWITIGGSLPWLSMGQFVGDRWVTTHDDFQGPAERLSNAGNAPPTILDDVDKSTLIIEANPQRWGGSVT